MWQRSGKGAPVANYASLPYGNNYAGEERVTLDTYTTYIYKAGTGWIAASDRGGGFAVKFDGSCLWGNNKNAGQCSCGAQTTPTYIGDVVNGHAYICD